MRDPAGGYFHLQNSVKAIADRGASFHVFVIAAVSSTSVPCLQLWRKTGFLFFTCLTVCLLFGVKGRQMGCIPDPVIFIYRLKTVGLDTLRTWTVGMTS